MKRSVAVIALLGALLTGGAIGLALFGASASAQTDSSSSTSSDSSSSSTAPSSSSDSQSSDSDSSSGSTDSDDQSTPPADDTTPPPGPRGHGPGGRHGPGGHPNLGVAADTIGISDDELRTALQDGQTIAQVAQAHNVDPQKVIDALVADASTHIDQAVADGRITQEQADQKKAELPQRMADLVNNTGPAGCPGMGPGSGEGPGAPPTDGQNPDSDTNSSSASNTNASFRI